ncbi:MAG: biopolymer transporter ExbD [candidate division WOR-3 bacterium]|nr:biopolymer transporter ExbD [candidate division WOR-3 bacterium]
MNITSLADVAINLMIIFLIAGISVALSRAGILINVPRSSAAMPQTTEGIMISIDKQNKIYIEDNPVNINEFDNKLSEILAHKSTMQAYLSADESVNYGLIMQVISKIKEAGIEHIGLVATPQLRKKTKR